MEIDRRQLTSMAAAALTILPVSIARAAQSPADKNSGPFWHQRVKRILQVNFNELDPADMDVEAYANLLAEAKAQATLISVTGSVSFYPSSVPEFYPAKGLNGRDLFGECVAALKKRGIRVIGRFSPDIAQVKAAERHPEWFQREADGKINTRNGNLPPGYGQTCQFTTYFTEQTPAIMRELLDRYDIDGLYTNGWPNTRVQQCYCQACRKIGDPKSQAYADAYLARAVELWGLFTSIAQEKRADRLFAGNLGGGLEGGELDLAALTKNAAWFIADNQGRPVGTPAWDAAQQARIGGDIMGGRPLLNITAAYGRSSPVAWRNGTGNAAEVQTRLAQTAAAGGTLYYHWLGAHQGFVEDRRWHKPGKDFLSWQARHDAHFHNVRSLANVAVIGSPRSNRFYVPPEGGEAQDSVQGLYAILMEARIPFDLITGDDLSLAKLSRYKAVLLPNVAGLSDGQAAQLAAYVGGGGSLMTTFETGLYDENGKPRADFALANLFGMRRLGDRNESRKPLPGRDTPYPANYPHLQRLEKPHPITRGFTDTNWILGPIWSVPVQSQDAPVLTLIDPYPVYPTEQTYSRTPHTQKPALVLRERGSSRLAHLTGDNEATYWRTHADDLAQLVANTVRWLIRDDAGITIDGVGLVEVFPWQTEPGYAVHLVNYTNPNAYKGIFRRHYPIGPQRVRLTLPADTRIARAKLLRSEANLPFQQKGRVLEFVVPSVTDYEVAAFEI